MRDLYQLLTVARQHKDKDFAIATIINIRGSAYRHRGAKMLFMENGQRFGTISAGCLEEDLSHVAAEVIVTGKNRQVTYNLMSEDDLSWGRGAGCNGEIDIYVEPFHWCSEWESVKKLMDDGECIVSVKKLFEGESKTSMCTTDGRWLREKFDMEENKIISLYIDEFLKSGNDLSVVNVKELTIDFLFEKYEPNDQLYIFGAGTDVEPLAKLAYQMNFTVTVVDPRSSRCTKENFPNACLAVQHPVSFLEEIFIPKDSFVLIMTHSFEQDQSILKRLVHNELTFLGVLGPRRRSERLMSPEPLPDWVKSPVGIEIGAEGPDEISVSIVAQLLQFRNRHRIKEQKGESFKEQACILS